MTETDIRWQQRFSQFQKGLAQLREAVALMDERELSRLEKQGVIQAFEFTYELAWNVLKDYLVWQGYVDVVGSRDAIRESFARGLVADGQAWMNMLLDRNRTAHTYNETTAEAILTNIRTAHFAQLEALESDMTAKMAG